MIEFLQIFDTDFVLLCNRRQRFSFGHDMRIGVARRCRGSGSAPGRRSTWRRLADHDAGMGRLLFDFQNLLGKGIDLRVNLVEFFRERLDLWRRRVFWGLRESNSTPNNESCRSHELHRGNFGISGRVRQARGMAQSA